mmetsp:Transcript_34836/g.84179  ORF Transcript_34836/g.84179 Transcript_34836/m.84179 type:complete len:319 (+) Transcript_34836:420-1376(+)
MVVASTVAACLFRCQNLSLLRLLFVCRIPPALFASLSSSSPVFVALTCRMSKSGMSSCDEASYVERKSSGMDAISSLSILSSGSSLIKDSICIGFNSGLALKGVGAETTALRGQSTSSATALSRTFANSFLSQGICVMSPPATLISNPTCGGLGRDIRRARHPGSSVIRPQSISLTGPSNLKFWIVTGILAPNDETLSSRSARAFDFHDISRSNAMSRSPRSNSRASRTRGATSPMLNFLRISLRIWELPLAVSRSASCNADSNGAVSMEGKMRSNMYWMGINPGRPTAAEYIFVSLFIASTLSVNTRATSATPSLNV